MENKTETKGPEMVLSDAGGRRRPCAFRTLEVIESIRTIERKKRVALHNTLTTAGMNGTASVGFVQIIEIV